MACHYMIIKRLFKERRGEDISRAENKYSVPVTQEDIYAII